MQEDLTSKEWDANLYPSCIWGHMQLQNVITSPYKGLKCDTSLETTNIQGEVHGPTYVDAHIHKIFILIHL